MLTYSEKFKDRTPQETINIIQNYFEFLNCELKVPTLEEATSGTWTSRVELYFNGNLLFGQNGKGTSKEYCLASGYGEVYERFCNKMFYINNAPLMKRVRAQSLIQNNYSFDPEEKEITMDQAFDSAIGKVFLSNYDNANHTLKNYYNTVFENQFIGIPYKNVYDENDIRYFDPRVISFLTGSTGMATGNNFYEAYIQGMSEIYEHFVSGRLFTEEKDKYYAINLDIIQNPLLQNIISKIQVHNTLYIYDLSYNFNVPVLMSLIVNKNTHAIIINLGSAPTIEIAIERILTELYQGYYDFETAHAEGQFPSKNACDFKMKDYLWAGTLSTTPIFPEFIIDKTEFTNYFNENIFLFENNYTNKMLYEHMESINKLNNFKVYYYNSSGCKNMYAIKLFEVNTPFFMMHFDLCNDIDTTNIIAWAIDLYHLIDNYLLTDNFILEDLILLQQRLIKFTEMELIFLLHLMYDHWFCWTNSSTVKTYRIIMIVNSILFQKDNFIMLRDYLKHFILNPHIYEAINKYSTIMRYVNAPGYSNDTIIKVLDYLEIKYTLEDLQNLNNDYYLMKNILFADLNNYLSGNYNSYINMLANYRIN